MLILCIVLIGIKASDPEGCEERDGGIKWNTINNVSHHQLECWKDLKKRRNRKTRKKNPTGTSQEFLVHGESQLPKKAQILERSGCSDGQQEIGMAPCQVFQLPLAIDFGQCLGDFLLSAKIFGQFGQKSNNYQMK